MVVTLEQLVGRQKAEGTYYPADVRLVDGQVIKTFRIQEMLGELVLGYKADNSNNPVGSDKICVLKRGIASVYVPYWELQSIA